MNMHKTVEEYLIDLATEFKKEADNTKWWQFRKRRRLIYKRDRALEQAIEASKKIK